MILNWERTFIFTEVLSLRIPTGQSKRKMLAGIAANYELQNFPSAPLASLRLLSVVQWSSMLLGSVTNRLSAVRRSDANRRGYVL